MEMVTDGAKAEQLLQMHNDSVLHMQNCTFEVLQRGQELCQVCVLNMYKSCTCRTAPLRSCSMTRHSVRYVWCLAHAEYTFEVLVHDKELCQVCVVSCTCRTAPLRSCCVARSSVRSVYLRCSRVAFTCRSAPFDVLQHGQELSQVCVLCV